MTKKALFKLMPQYLKEELCNYFGEQPRLEKHIARDFDLQHQYFSISWDGLRSYPDKESVKERIEEFVHGNDALEGYELKVFDKNGKELTWHTEVIVNF